METFTQFQQLVGREKILKQLKLALRSKSKKFHKRIVVVAGLGGMGKSFLVNKYVEKYKADPCVLVRADTSATLAADFKTLMSKFGIKIQEGNLQQSVDEFYRLISDKTLLIILDNARPTVSSVVTNCDDSGSDIGGENLQCFLPSPEVAKQLEFLPRILITSRFRSWNYYGKILPVIELKQLSLLEKERYLVDQLCPKILTPDKNTAKVIHKVAKVLQGYPLTLVLASAYLKNILATMELPAKNNSLLLNFVARLKTHLNRLDTSINNLPYTKLNAKKEKYDAVLSYIWNNSLATIFANEKSKGVQFYMATISVFYPFENWFRFTVSAEKLDAFKLLQKFALVPPVREELSEDGALARITIHSKHLSKQLVRFMQLDVLECPEHVFINNHPISWLFLDFCWGLHSGLRDLAWPGMGIRISNLILLNLLVNTTDQERRSDKSAVIGSLAKAIIKDLTEHDNNLNDLDRKRLAVDIVVRDIVTIIWDLIYGNEFESEIKTLNNNSPFYSLDNPDVCLSKSLSMILEFKEAVLVQVLGAKLIHILYIETNAQFSKETLVKLRDWVTLVLIPSQNKFDSYYKLPIDKSLRNVRIAFKLTEEHDVLPLGTLFSLLFQQLDQMMNDDSALAYRYWLLLCGYVKEKKLFWNFRLLSKSFPFERSESEEKTCIYKFIAAHESTHASTYDDLTQLDDILTKVNIVNPEFELKTRLDRHKRLHFVESGGLLMLIKGLRLFQQRRKFVYTMKICEIIQELCRSQDSQKILQMSSDFLIALEDALTFVLINRPTMIERSALICLVTTVFAICIPTTDVEKNGRWEDVIPKDFFTNILRTARKQLLVMETSRPHSTLLYLPSNECKYTCLRTMKKFTNTYWKSNGPLHNKFNPMYQFASEIVQLLNESNPAGCGNVERQF